MNLNFKLVVSVTIGLFFIQGVSFSQTKMSPELLWKLGRVKGLGLSKDKKHVFYEVVTPDVEQNKMVKQVYSVSVLGGKTRMIDHVDSIETIYRVSPDGKYDLRSYPVKINKVYGSDMYSDLSKSNVYIYESLDYRHWDSWDDGQFNHVVITPIHQGRLDKTQSKDIMLNEPYDCPQRPFGEDKEDMIWSPDSKRVIYVAKKKFGTAYTLSTNTDIYEYNLETAKTANLTEGMMGYDRKPAFNKKGKLAWLSMKHDGNEADKEDIVVYDGIKKRNLTQHRDSIHVEEFIWSEDGKVIYFSAPLNGTFQLFSVNDPISDKQLPTVRQITKGNFDIKHVIGQSGHLLVVSREDMNHAAELYTVDVTTGQMNALTHVNDLVYSTLNLCPVESRRVLTTDGKNMLVWVIYPPNFDRTKKYPTLLYCQGGPQVPLTQYYSFRWNFQLMASQGYIVVAPNRRGMPGHGTAWNEQISTDWGGQVIKDYLSAIDAVSKESFVDKTKLGCIGASFGGFAVFTLAAVHENRFKSFIAHDGVFDFRSMSGTTDEVFFDHWETGGFYWEKNNPVAQRSLTQSPSNYVEKWNTPILIIQGGKDFRVPIEQGQQAFQAAQLRGIKSKFLYFPDENHWVLAPQNALVWQREFYKWLRETLN